MRRKVLSLLIATASLLSVTTGANDIEPGKEFYTVPRRSNPIVLDGDLSEWTGVPVLADPKFYVRTGLEGRPEGKGSGGVGADLVLFERCFVCIGDPNVPDSDWTGPDDHTSAVQLVYDADNVYLGFVVTDEYHENAANSAWNGDAVQIMIANSNRTAQVALYNYALGGTEENLGAIIIEHEAGAPGQPAPGVTEAVVTRNTNTLRTTYEIRLPKAAVGLTNLAIGAQFGLGMAINDGDQANPGQGGWGGLGAHAIVFGKTPSETALITLGTAGGGNDRLFFSAINPTIDFFAFRVNDLGAAILNPATVRLVIDGQTNIPTASPKVLDATDFTYTPSPPFSPGDHTYVISARDTLGTTVTDAGTFRIPIYALLSAADKLTNPTEPGFVWKIHQNGRFTNSSISRALHQLAGLLGQNLADPQALGASFFPGVPGPTTNHPITFELEDLLDLNQVGGTFAGEFGPDQQMPGIPGLGPTDQADGIAAEITTFLELPAGRITLVVNSDDGFRTTAGNINDLFRAQVAAEFNGGRPATDTAFTLRVAEAGVYAFRTVYEDGTGLANIEWKLQKEDGTNVLLNDVLNGGPIAYRRAVGLPTGINMVSPLPGTTGVAFDAPIFASILEGTPTVDLNSVRLSLDGAPLAVTPTRAGNLISVNYQPSFLSSTQHTAALSYTAGGLSRTQSWSFTIEPYAILSSAHKALSVNTDMDGFIWRVFQNETFTHTSLAQTELALAGQLIAPGQTQPLTNFAEPNNFGVAFQPGTTDGPLIRFEILTTINLNQTGGNSIGNFTPDGQMPGIPGTNGGSDGIDAEIVTFVSFPAGITLMGVNSDDGFRTQAGYINRPADGVILGQFDGGRAAADTIFKILVQEAGFYPLRTIWQDGTEEGNIEWFTVNSDGTKVLLNDTINGGLPAFRVGVAPNKPLGPLAIQRVGGQVRITWTEPGAVLEESTNLVTWTTLNGITSPYTATPGTAKPIAFYRLKK